MTYITSLSLNTRYRTIWNNKVDAIIIDLENKGEFHLIDFSDGHYNSNLLGDINQREKSKVVASGLIGAWLHQCVAEYTTKVDLNKLFAAYSKRCEDKYVSFVNSTPEYYGVDAKKVFYMANHLLQEEKSFMSSTAIYPFLAEEDIQNIENLKEKYKQYIQNKYKELYPPKLETFLSYFDGDQSIAFRCIRLYLQKMDKEDVHGRKYPLNYPYYSEKEKYEILTKCSLEDLSILRGRDNAIFKEIKTELEQKQQDDKLRYIHTILNSLRNFSSLVYPIDKIDLIRKLIDKWNQRIRDGYKKDNCMNSIEKYEESISIMRLRSEEFFSMPDFGQTAKKELYDYLMDEEDYSRKFMALYLDFARRLDSLLMYYGIDLLEIEIEQGIYLCPPQEWPLLGGDEFYLTIKAAETYYYRLPKREANKQVIEAKFSGEYIEEPVPQESSQDIPDEHPFEMTEVGWVVRYKINDNSLIKDQTDLINRIKKLRYSYIRGLKQPRFNRTGFLRDNIFVPKTAWLIRPYELPAEAIRDLFNDTSFSDSMVSKAKKQKK